MPLGRPPHRVTAGVQSGSYRLEKHGDASAGPLYAAPESNVPLVGASQAVHPGAYSVLMEGAADADETPSFRAGAAREGDTQGMSITQSVATRWNSGARRGRARRWGW